jgi:cytochrome c peroxidase
VRAAPLVALRASAPYLHNGSVPTLRALLEPVAKRPVSFPLGAAGFVLDTRVPGNRNHGHEYGTALSQAEKRDLIAFLETL